MNPRLALGDVNEFCTNAKTDFQKAKFMGCTDAFLRATTTGKWVNGKPIVRMDAMYQSNKARLKEIGFNIWDYCWFDPRVRYVSSEEQSEYFLSVAADARRPVLDMEGVGSIVYDAAGFEGARKWLEAVEKSLGIEPAIYTFPAFISQAVARGIDVSWMREYPLIIAHWDVAAPFIPFPWHPGSEIGWQYTAYAPGKYYGFVTPTGGAIRICMAVVGEDR
jgi:GH25 family lysozyme M1 (1,4-beta-N-acetylmuramidase)